MDVSVYFTIANDSYYTCFYSDFYLDVNCLSKGADNSFHPHALGKKFNIEGYGYILVCK